MKIKVPDFHPGPTESGSRGLEIYIFSSYPGGSYAHWSLRLAALDLFLQTNFTKHFLGSQCQFQLWLTAPFLMPACARVLINTHRQTHRCILITLFYKRLMGMGEGGRQTNLNLYVWFLDLKDPPSPHFALSSPVTFLLCLKRFPLLVFWPQGKFPGARTFSPQPQERLWCGSLKMGELKY